jgi:methylenetetrahydrofolate dehydrogenase (NADP+)/methenyltetrahydrofolate cyclohydrolase
MLRNFAIITKMITSYIEQQKQELAKRIQSFSRPPKLVIVQANEHEPSNIYIRGKIQDCHEVGIEAVHIRFPTTVSEHDLVTSLKKLNEDTSVDGIIVQLPLPSHIHQQMINLAIHPEKDVDGFHPLSPYIACTPKGIVDYLTAIDFHFSGKHALIMGRSSIVGKPLIQQLLNRDMTVSVVHSKTQPSTQLSLLEQADLICVAVGKKWILSDQKIKPSAYLIDVGINREEGVLHGDIKPGRHVALQTPVPGGVGLLTRLSLLKNCVEAYQRLRR